jgi:aromatic ring-cleaving dioxygenase
MAACWLAIISMNNEQVLAILDEPQNGNDTTDHWRRSICERMRRPT